MNWTATTYKKLKNIKISILKKKIMLNFIIESFSFRDKLYRYLHISISLLTIIFSVISDSIKSDATDKITIVFSIIVAIMIKIKDYITYDQVRDSAKVQTVKYTQLYERIDREIDKDDKQAESEFIYWINREFQHIETMDPELSYSDQKKFIQFCKSRKIHWNDDINTIDQLLKDESTVVNSAANTDNTEHKIDVAPAESRITIEHTHNADINYNKQDIQKNMSALSTSADMNWTMQRLSNI